MGHVVGSSAGRPSVTNFGCTARRCGPHASTVVAGGRRLVHLICLRCNHANPSGARFCSQCGAGLLRKFCSQCHVINDAESHFCMSCGAGLSTHPPVPAAAPTAMPSDVPELTDVADVAPDDEMPLQWAPAAPLQTNTIDGAPPLPVLAAESRPAALERSRPMPRTPLLFGFGGGAVMLLAAALWSRPVHTNAPALDPDTSAAAAASQAAHAAMAPAPASATEVAPLPAAAAPGTDTRRADAVPPPAPRAAVKQGNKPTARDAGADATLAVQPLAAASPLGAAPERRESNTRAVPQPAVPAAECTPQVDALGLCAPGTTVTER